jgi:DMSO/TMAO reductase YedYZ molybdopterin-dependent catalytic subunit
MNRVAYRLALICLIGLTAQASAALAAETVRYLAPGKSPVALDEKTLAAMPRMTVQAGAHGDAPSAWEGVALVEVLRAEGAPLGKALRGDALANYVRVTATDGYQVVFGLGELDAEMGAAKVVLVDRHEGKPLDDKDGPVRLVVPGDKRPARWVRNVATIELLSASTRAPKP